MKTKKVFSFFLILTLQSVLSSLNAQSWMELNNKVSEFFKKEKYEKAYKMAEKACLKAENEFGKSSDQFIVSAVNLAEIYRRIGFYNKAEKRLKESIIIFEKKYGKNNPYYASICNNFAVLYSGMGNFPEAETYFTEAKNIRENYFGKKHRYYAESCNNLAELYYSLGNYKKAESLLIESNEIYKKVSKKNKKDPYYAGSCNNLAELYNTTGKYKKAELLLKEAKTIREKIFGKKHPEYALSCVNLAENYLKTKKYKDAEKLFTEAKIIYEKVYGKEHILFANVCNNLAVLYIKTGKSDEAELLLKEAKEIIEKKYGKKHPYYAEICANLAGLYEFAGDNIQDKNKKEGMYKKSELLYYELDGILNSYIRESAKYLSEREREQYLTKKLTDKFNKIYSFFLTKRTENKRIGAVIYSNLLNLKGQLLRSAAAVRKLAVQSGDTVLLNAYDKMNFYGKILNEQNLYPAEQRRSDLKQIKEKLNTAEKELIKNSQIYSEILNKQRISWQFIRMCLKKDEAATEFFSFHYRNNLKQTDSVLYYALVLRSHFQNPEIVFLSEEKQVQNLLRRPPGISEYEYIKNLYDPESTKADSLYKLLWQPLENYLKDVKNVYISPAGLLNRIAFDALPYDKKDILSDKYKIIYMSSTAEITNDSNLYRKNIKNAVLFGGLKYGVKPDVTNKSNSISDSLTRNLSWDYLPGSFDEVKEIQTVMKNAGIKVKLYSGNEGSENRFNELNKNAPDILHISTHGFYFGNDEKNNEYENILNNKVQFVISKNPLLRSGFILSGGNAAFSGKRFYSADEDGVLTAAEISRLNLFKTKLAVLSACQTGLGDIKGYEGVYGLQRAFKMAGTEYLLFSLWSVPDETTKELMINFYKNWLNGQEIRDAFKNAQNQLKEKYKDVPGAAFAWAAFVLMK